MLRLRSWLLQLAKDILRNEKSENTAHDYDHIIRVMSLAEHIQMHEGGDLLAIWASVVFHDIGIERERRYGGDHAHISADMAKEVLVNTEFPQDTIPTVLQAIQEHRKTRGKAPSTIEGRILYDADKIDILGAIGIGRLFCVTGYYNQKVYSVLPKDIQHPVDPIQVRLLRRQPDYSPSIEFQLLFNTLPNHMMTQTGQKMAWERYNYMVAFFDRLQKEIAGIL